MDRETCLRCNGAGVLSEYADRPDNGVCFSCGGKGERNAITRRGIEYRTYPVKLHISPGEIWSWKLSRDHIQSLKDGMLRLRHNVQAQRMEALAPGALVIFTLVAGKIEREEFPIPTNASESEA